MQRTGKRLSRGNEAATSVLGSLSLNTRDGEERLKERRWNGDEGLLRTDWVSKGRSAANGLSQGDDVLLVGDSTRCVGGGCEGRTGHVAGENRPR